MTDELEQMFNDRTVAEFTVTMNRYGPDQQTVTKVMSGRVGGLVVGHDNPKHDHFYIEFTEPRAGGGTRFKVNLHEVDSIRVLTDAERLATVGT